MLCKWSPIGQWCMSPELTVSLPSHCLPTTGSWPLILTAWYPKPHPVYPLSALPWDQKPQAVGGEAQLIGHSPLLLAGVGVGWVRCMPHSIMKRNRAVVIPTQSWQLYGTFSRQLKGASRSQSRYWEFLSMKVETTWGSHICCGLGQQTLGKAILPSPPPARLLLNHFVLSSTNYVAGST